MNVYKQILMIGWVKTVTYLGFCQDPMRVCIGKYEIDQWEDIFRQKAILSIKNYQLKKGYMVIYSP